MIFALIRGMRTAWNPHINFCHGRSNSEIIAIQLIVGLLQAGLQGLCPRQCPSLSVASEALVRGCGSSLWPTLVVQKRLYSFTSCLCTLMHKTETFWKLKWDNTFSNSNNIQPARPQPSHLYIIFVVPSNKKYKKF